MPVQTRNAAHKLLPESPYDDQSSRHTPTPLAAERIISQTDISSTGKGTSTQWIRSSEQNPPASQPMFPIDNTDRANRFQTPVPVNRDSSTVPAMPKQRRHSRPSRYKAGQRGSVSPHEEVVADFRKYLRINKGKNPSTELLHHYATENHPPQPISRSSSSQNDTSSLESPFSGWPSPKPKSQRTGQPFPDASRDRCSAVDNGDETIA